MKFLKSYYKSIIWAIIVAFILFTSGDEIPKFKLLDLYGIDKLIHIILFMVFQFLLLFDSLNSMHFLNLRKIVLLVFIAIIYAGSSEIIQLIFIEKRQGSVFDFIADMVGVSLAYVIYLVYKRTKDRPYHPIS
jgi:VanZ family protein